MGKKSRIKRDRHQRHSDNSCPTEADLRCGVWFKKIEKGEDGAITMKHLHYRDVVKDYEVQERTNTGPNGEAVKIKFWVPINRPDDFFKRQKKLDPVFENVLHNNLWDLYEE